MPIFEQFPYTNLHELNLDYILETQRKQEEEFENVIEEATELKDETKQYHDETEVLHDQSVELKNETQTLHDETQTLKNDTQDLHDQTVDIKNTLQGSLTQIETNKVNIAVNSARIDEFTHLTDGSTSGDAELQDIRIGANGVTYDTAGDAVRGQYTELDTDIKEVRNGLKSNNTVYDYGYRYSYNDPSLWESGLIDPYGTEVSNDNCKRTENFIPSFIECIAVTLNSGLQIRITVYDSNDDFEENIDWNTGYLNLDSTKKYRISIRRVSGGSSVSYDDTQSILLLSVEDKNTIRRKTVAIQSGKAENINNINIKGWINAYIDNSTGNLISNSSAIACNDFFTGKLAMIKDPAYEYCLGEYATDGSFVKRIGWMQNSYILDTTKKYRVSLRKKGGSISVTETKSIDILSGDNIAFSNYYNYNLSILGDSISTYEDYIPTSNYYYPRGDVDRVENCWWYKLKEALGMSVLVNNSVSGSCISEAGSSGAASGYSRARYLHDGTTPPDVIIVAMGVNDFLQDVPLGTYDGTQTFPTSANDFRSAYAMTLNAIMDQYPRAEVYCATIMNCERYDDPGFPEKRNDVLLNDFNKAIRDMADLFGCKVLDHDKCGITYQNLSRYMVDWNSTLTQGLHPNNVGHSLMANNDIKQMDNAIRIKY